MICIGFLRFLRDDVKNIDTDFVDFGGVERGPDAEINRGERKFRFS